MASPAMEPCQWSGRSGRRVQSMLCGLLSMLMLPLCSSFSVPASLTLAKSHKLPIVRRHRIGQPSSAVRSLEMSGFFSNLFAGPSDEDREDIERVVSAITTPAGWSVNLEIGSQIAKSLGGSGTMAKGDIMNVNIGVAIRMTQDEGYDPPQGSVFVESDSAIFSGESFWCVTEDTDAGVPTAIQASLKCPDGIKLSGEIAVPAGQIYLNFKVKEGEAVSDVEFFSGRATVKEDVKSSFLLTAYDGLLAEFKIIGTCSAKPRALASDTAASD